MGLFPHLKSFIPKEGKHEIVQELLGIFASLTNSVGPLRKELPVPYMINGNNESPVMRLLEVNNTAKSSMEY